MQLAMQLAITVFIFSIPYRLSRHVVCARPCDSALVRQEPHVIPSFIDSHPYIRMRGVAALFIVPMSRRV
jgi:hypothetical protein